MGGAVAMAARRTLGGLGQVLAELTEPRLEAV